MDISFGNKRNQFKSILFLPSLTSQSRSLSFAQSRPMETSSRRRLCTQFCLLLLLLLLSFSLSLSLSACVRVRLPTNFKKRNKTATQTKKRGQGHHRHRHRHRLPPPPRPPRPPGGAPSQSQGQRRSREPCAPFCSPSPALFSLLSSPPEATLSPSR